MNRPKREAAKNAELKRQLEEQQNISDEGSVFLDDSEAESADENANGGDDDSEVESYHSYPSSKRQKTEESPESNSSEPFQTLPMGKSKKQGKLSLLPSMPLDVLFVIFSFLHPRDILSLARTTRTFRDVLISRQAKTIWKTARERVDAPECPSIMSEHNWANLLLGHVCQSCGRKNVRDSDVGFTSLRRSCKSCKSAHLLSLPKVKKRFHTIDLSVLDLLPYLKKGNAYKKHYWDTEIEHMTKKIARFQKNIKKRVPDAQQALDDFKATRKAAIEKLPKLASAVHEFISEQGRDSDIGQRRLDLIKQRFKELGYKDSDLEFLRWNSACTRRAELTDQAWQGLRKSVEAEIIANQKARLEQATRIHRQARRCLIRDGLEKYRKNVPSSQWKHLPTPLEIGFLEPFARHVTSISSAAVTMQTFDEAFELLPELLKESDGELLHHLLGRLPNAKKLTNATKGKGKMRVSTSTSAAFNPLELAHSVFKCQLFNRCRTLIIGSDAILSHHCVGENSGISSTAEIFDYNRDFTFYKEAALLAEKVVELSGLEPSTATVADMDGLDLRFACTCISAPEESTGFDWRHMIQHLVVNQSHRHYWREHRFYVLLSEQAQIIKLREENHKIWQQRKWICAHCPDFSPLSCESETVVKTHVIEKHSIADPKRGEDVLYFNRDPLYPTSAVLVSSIPENAMTLQSSKPSKPVVPRLEQLEGYKCLRCADAIPSLRNKIHALDAVQAHLLSKHQVASPKVNIDYVETSLAK